MLPFLLRPSAKAMFLGTALQGTSRQMRVTTTMVLFEVAFYGTEISQRPLEVPRQTPEAVSAEARAVATAAVPAGEWQHLWEGIPWSILAVAHSLLDVCLHWVGGSPGRTVYRFCRMRQRKTRFNGNRQEWGNRRPGCVQ